MVNPCSPKWNRALLRVMAEAPTEEVDYYVDTIADGSWAEIGID